MFSVNHLLTIQVGRCDSDTVSCLLGNQSVSKAAFFHSSFFLHLPSQKGGGGRNPHSRKLCKTSFTLFWTVLRKRVKACEIDSLWECWKKTCPTLALPYTSWSGLKQEREGKRKVVNWKMHFCQGSCGVTQRSGFKSSWAVVTWGNIVLVWLL